MGAMERNFQVGELYFMSTADNVVAAAGAGGQAGAEQLLPRMITRVTGAVATVAPFDGIMLPPARPGSAMFIINHSGQNIQVYGQPGDIINDVATAVGVTQMPNSVVMYVCMLDGVWYSESLALGFASGFPTQSFAGALTAHSGGGQALGTPITAAQNIFTVVAAPGDSALLPAAKPGMQIAVINATAATSMNVFPASGETINAGAADAALAVGGATATIFYCATAGNWRTK